jgi:hypothetical protein
MADEAPPAPDGNEELLLNTPVVEPEDDGGEEVLTFGEEAEPQDNDTGLVKHLRSQIRERDRRLAEVEKAPRAQPVDPGPEPTLEDCDYDEDKLKVALRKWDREVQESKEPAVQADEAQRKAYETERQRYVDGKAKINHPEMEDAEETVKASLSPAQQSALVLASDDPAKMVLALFKNPAKLAELASETNVVKLGAKVAKLEGQLKMVKRRAPDPDTPERGSAQVSRQTNAAQKKLDKMEADYKGGDRSHIQQFKRENGLK